MISKNNYEIWFLDYFEGNLKEEDIPVLYDFLDKYPILKKEFDEFELLYLDKVKTVYNGKEKLKQKLNINTVANLDEFDTLVIKSLEGELSDEEKKELNSILNFSEIKQKEFRAYNLTLLKPDKHLIFGNKENLKKNPGFVIPLWIRYVSSVAAIVLILVFVKNTFFNKSKQFNEGNQFVKSEKNNKKEKQQRQKIIELTVENNTGTTKKNNTTIIEKNRAKNYDFHKKTGEKTGEETKFPGNSNVFIAYTPIKITIPESHDSRELMKIKPRLKEIVFIKRNSTNIIKTQKKAFYVEALTPKQFLIKNIKTKLEIDDNNYDKINPVEIASASLEKLKIAKIDYGKNPKTKKKYFSLNFRGLEIERVWASN